MDVQTDRESDAVTVISALLLWFIKSYFDIWNSASRASLTKWKESISCSNGPRQHTQVQNTAYTTLRDDQQRTGWGKLSQWKPAILFYYINLFVVCVCVCVCITLLHILC